MRATLRLLGLLLALIPWKLPPAWAQTCATTATLNYTNTGTTGDERIRSRTVNGTSYTFSGYTSSVPTGQTNLFAVGTNGALIGQSLVWQVDNTGNNGSNTASVTLTFTRPVNNLTLQLQDIDADVNFVDDLVFDAYVGGNTVPATLTSGNFTFGANNAYVSGNRVQGTASSAAGAVSGNLTATMPAGVTKLVITYSNTRPYSTANRTQTLGINSISWCAQSDIYALYTSGPNAVVSGGAASYTVQFGNYGPDVPATNVSRTVTLPAGAVVTNNGGGIVSGNTINFGTVARTLR